MTRIVFALATFLTVTSLAAVKSPKAHKPRLVRIPITSDFLIETKHPTQLIYSARQDITKFKSVKTYANHWLREFPKFGFEVEYARPSQFRNLDGYEFELIERTSDKHVFQKVAVVDGKALVFTLVEKSPDYEANRESLKKWLGEASIQKIRVE